MGFELSLKFRLRHLITREYGFRSRRFCFVHDPPPCSMACCARDCPTVIGERRMVLAGMLNGALRRQPPAAASGRAPCSICLAPDAAVQPFIDVRFASPAVAAGSQTWHACPILV